MGSSTQDVVEVHIYIQCCEFSSQYISWAVELCTFQDIVVDIFWYLAGGAVGISFHFEACQIVVEPRVSHPQTGQCCFQFPGFLYHCPGPMGDGLLYVTEVEFSFFSIIQLVPCSFCSFLYLLVYFRLRAPNHNYFPFVIT